MAGNGDLPRFLAGVHPRHEVPQRAAWLAGAIVAVLVALADLRSAIGFSSFAVLAYYAIANASAWTLPAEARRWPRALSAVGVLGCVALAFSLPLRATIPGAALLVLGALTFLGRRYLRGN
jgi:APA family basic amino acid/polyamine antiporter